jgi:hypothetical protein
VGSGGDFFVETGISELSFGTGPLDDESREDPNGFNEETAVVDSMMGLSVSSPELTGVRDEDLANVEPDTSGNEDFVDPSVKVFGMEV